MEILDCLYWYQLLVYEFRRNPFEMTVLILVNTSAILGLAWIFYRLHIFEVGVDILP